MLILYDFKCRTCGHTQEALVLSTCREIRCEECTQVSDRQISPVRSKLDGTDPGFPTAYDKWARQHEHTGKAEPK